MLHGERSNCPLAKVWTPKTAKGAHDSDDPIHFYAKRIDRSMRSFRHRMLGPGNCIRVRDRVCNPISEGVWSFTYSEEGLGPRSTNPTSLRSLPHLFFHILDAIRIRRKFFIGVTAGPHFAGEISSKSFMADIFTTSTASNQQKFVHAFGFMFQQHDPTSLFLPLAKHEEKGATDALILT